MSAPFKSREQTIDLKIKIYFYKDKEKPGCSYLCGCSLTHKIFFKQTISWPPHFLMFFYVGGSYIVPPGDLCFQMDVYFICKTVSVKWMHNNVRIQVFPADDCVSLITQSILFLFNFTSKTVVCLFGYFKDFQSVQGCYPACERLCDFSVLLAEAEESGPAAAGTGP